MECEDIYGKRNSGQGAEYVSVLGVQGKWEGSLS